MLACWLFGYFTFLCFEGPVISITKTYLTKSMNSEEAIKVKSDANGNYVHKSE